MAAVIRIDILGDSRSAQRSARDAERGYDRLGRGADRSSGKVGKFGAAMGAAARRYGPLAAAAAAGGVIKIGLDSIQAASRLQQSFGSIDAVFGRNRAIVKRWARSAANDVGLAKSAYAELAVVAGSMLKNTGIENYTEQTHKLIELGADLAATFGGTTKDAMVAINALFRGEADPIERYGVNIKATAIAAELAAKGQDKLRGAALLQAQQQARLKLLFDQTTAAQGRFRAESDTLAVSQQKLGAKWENLKATLGEKLLPVATRFVTWLGNAITGSNDTGKAVRKLADIYLGYVTPVVEGAVRGWKKFSDGVDDATGETDSLRKGVQKVADWLEKYGPKIGRFVGGVLEDFGTAAGTAARLMGKVADAIDRTRRAADTALGPLDELIGKLGQANSGGGKLSGLLDPLGIFHSGVSLPGGLGRAAGVGPLGFAGGGTIRVAAPAVNLVVLLDGRELKHTARREARDEISTQVRAARGTR